VRRRLPTLLLTLLVGLGVLGVPRAAVVAVEASVQAPRVVPVALAPAPAPAVALGAAPANGMGAARAGSYQLQGLQRRYFVHLPRGVRPLTPAPVLVVLHGLDLSPAWAQHTTGFDALADKVGAVVVYPEGFGGSWSAGTCCGDAAGRGLDDVTALQVVLDRVAESTLVDRRRVVFVGFSNGGMLAHEVACRVSGQVAGIVVVGGSREYDPCRPTSPVRVVAVHGAQDRAVPLAGGRSTQLPGRLASETTSLLPYLSADGCRTMTSSRIGSRARSTRWGCDAGGVRLIVVNRLAHRWPTALPGSGSIPDLTWRMMRTARSPLPFGQEVLDAR
jgi:polyhydroxybutyrate depolymerase